MRSVWVALDSDGSGYLSAGEFGRFMRKGEEGVGSVSTTWRQNLHAKLQREREEFEAVLYKEARRNAHIEPAEESEVNEMAVKLTKKMHQVFVAQNPSWYEETRLGQGTSHCSPKPLIPLLPLTGTSCSVTWTTTAAARSHTPSSPTSSVTSFSSTSGSAPTSASAACGARSMPTARVTSPPASSATSCGGRRRSPSRRERTASTSAGGRSCTRSGGKKRRAS